MIQAYFNQIKVIVDQYAVTRFVLDANVSFETRPGEQGYLIDSMTFMDGSVLYFREFLDAVKETVDRLMYTYHYQDASNQLIFRYDNVVTDRLCAPLSTSTSPARSLRPPLQHLMMCWPKSP